MDKMDTQQLIRHIHRSDLTALEKRYLEGLVEARTPREGMRLIDAETLKKQFQGYRDNLRSCHYTPLALSVADDMIDYVDEAPTIEAEPVRHGWWIEKASEYYKEWQKAFGSDIFFEECEYFTDHIACSNCLKKYNYIDNDSTDEWKYCPNCGARMDGKENET